MQQSDKNGCLLSLFSRNLAAKVRKPSVAKAPEDRRKTLRAIRRRPEHAAAFWSATALRRFSVPMSVLNGGVWPRTALSPIAGRDLWNCWSRQHQLSGPCFRLKLDLAESAVSKGQRQRPKPPVLFARTYYSFFCSSYKYKCTILLVRLRGVSQKAVGLAFDADTLNI